MCSKCDQALFSNMISLITEGYCSMILGVLQPSPVNPKIEQVFIPTNIHRHRTPHPGYHAAHMAMAVG